MKFTIYDLRLTQANGSDGPALSARRLHHASTLQRFNASTSAFTMMEIAICLAVIGIALVAIIGVLPIGMNVQQSNRQETIIGQDASVLMEAVRNGSLGYDDLTNYVYAITNYWAQYLPVSQGGRTNLSGINYYTFGSVSVSPRYLIAVNMPAAAQQPITNGANIIGLMSTPEFIGETTDEGGDAPGQPIPSLYYGGISNHIVVYCRSISGPAIEKPPQDNQILQQDSFGYRIYCVNAPTAFDTNLLNQYSGRWLDSQQYASNSTVFYNWMYWTYDGSSLIQGDVPGEYPYVWQMTPQYNLELALNLHELRFTFEWPQLPNGRVGSGRETFRTMVAGELQRQSSLNPFNSASPIWSNPYLYEYLSQSFTNTP